MDCTHTTELLLDFVYDELDDVRASAVRKHLDSCSECSIRFSRLSRTRSLAAQLPLVEAPALSAAVRAAIESVVTPAAVPAGSGGAEGAEVIPLHAGRGRASRLFERIGEMAMRRQVAMAAVFLVMIGVGLIYYQTHPRPTDAQDDRVPDVVPASEVPNGTGARAARETNTTTTVRPGARVPAQVVRPAGPAVAVAPTVPRTTVAPTGTLADDPNAVGARDHANEPAAIDLRGLETPTPTGTTAAALDPARLAADQPQTRAPAPTVPAPTVAQMPSAAPQPPTPASAGPGATTFQLAQQGRATAPAPTGGGAGAGVVDLERERYNATAAQQSYFRSQAQAGAPTPTPSPARPPAVAPNSDMAAAGGATGVVANSAHHATATSETQRDETASNSTGSAPGMGGATSNRNDVGGQDAPAQTNRQANLRRVEPPTGAPGSAPTAAGPPSNASNLAEDATRARSQLTLARQLYSQNRLAEALNVLASLRGPADVQAQAVQLRAEIQGAAGNVANEMRVRAAARRPAVRRMAPSAPSPADNFESPDTQRARHAAGF